MGKIKILFGKKGKSALLKKILIGHVENACTYPSIRVFLGAYISIRENMSQLCHPSFFLKSDEILTSLTLETDYFLNSKIMD